MNHLYVCFLILHAEGQLVHSCLKHSLHTALRCHRPQGTQHPSCCTTIFLQLWFHRLEEYQPVDSLGAVAHWTNAWSVQSWAPVGPVFVLCCALLLQSLLSNNRLNTCSVVLSVLLNLPSGRNKAMGVAPRSLPLICSVLILVANWEVLCKINAVMH